MIVAVDTLREKAKSYELSALAKNDAGETLEASLSTAIAIALLEVAAALDEDS